MHTHSPAQPVCVTVAVADTEPDADALTDGDAEPEAVRLGEPARDADREPDAVRLPDREPEPVAVNVRVAVRVHRVQRLVATAEAVVEGAPALRGAKLERRARSACAPAAATTMGLLVERASPSLSPQPAAAVRPAAGAATARPPWTRRT